MFPLQGMSLASAEAAGSTVLAEWKYTVNPGDLGVFPAAGGAHQGGSTLQPVPPRQYYDWNDENKAIRYPGWHPETGKEKYWLVTVSTQDYEHITLSSAQQGKGTTGPRDFRVQISTDRQNWTNVTGEGTGISDLVLNPDTPSELNDVSLPQLADDQEQLYIRWVVSSDKSTSGSAIGDRGSSQLLGITVKGVLQDTTTPTVDTEAPSTPGAITASGITTGSVQLTWNASTDNIGVTGYSIYRDGAKVGSTDAFMYTDSGLTPSTTYRYAVTATDAAGNESAPSAGVEATTKNAAVPAVPVVLSEWVFANSGSGGAFPATGGALQASSSFRNVGGYFEDYDSSQHSISYQGWDNGSGQKFWLASLSTKGYDHITLSSQQTSSGTGPRDFKVQISSDNQNWTDVPGASLQMSLSSFNCANNACKLVDAPLPSGANDRDALYIRWVVSSNTNTKGTQGIGGTGSSLIKDVRISGTLKDGGGGPVETPTTAVAKSPGAGDASVIPTAPVTVTFNKPVSLSAGYNVVVTDKNNAALGSVTAEIISNNTLNIKHPAFVNGMTYTVRVPKELVKGRDDQVGLAQDISWSFTVQSAQGTPSVPKLINMTLSGDTKTSRAFAWYTDVNASSVVQVVPASQVTGGAFPESGALTFTGTTEEIQTYVTKEDRTANKKKKFYSHKVTATGLSPGTAYKYRLGSGQADSWSAIGSLTTDTAVSQPFHFIAGSDSQASSKTGFEPWADTFKKAVLTIGDPKFLINAGDLVDNGDLEEQWQWMLGLPQEQLLNVPIVPVVGGHEVRDYDGDETTPNSNFFNHFNLPKQTIANTHDGSVYSFEYGNALFLVFNSQYAGELSSSGGIREQDQQFADQLEWMKYIVAKSDAKWKFVTFHKGPYSAGDNAGEYEDDRVQFYKKVLVPAFDEMGIDMVFEAHDHMYMRSYQMLNDKVIPTSQITYDAQGNAVNPKGTIYLMSNSFGDKFYTKYPGYNDYFAAIDTQPNKKMFTDVSVSDNVLQIKAYTAAKKDESSGNNGVKLYDQYGIKRTDTKPSAVEGAKVQVSGGKAVISWKSPSSSSEPVKGFRIYEKSGKVKTYWNVYVPVESGKSDYSITVNNISSSTPYQFVIRSAGSRMNSDPVSVSIN